jgi:hypothetical protein
LSLAKEVCRIHDYTACADPETVAQVMRATRPGIWTVRIEIAGMTSQMWLLVGNIGFILNRVGKAVRHQWRRRTSKGAER